MKKSKIEIIRQLKGGKKLLIDGHEIKQVTSYQIQNVNGLDGIVITIIDADISIYGEEENTGRNPL